MAELQWLDGYGGETVDELIALEGKYRTDSLVLAFEQAMDQKAARVGDDKLTDEEWIILAIEALEREVNNGGYDQFFVNSSRDFAPIIVNALRRIGCPTTAEITQKALKIAQETPMTDEEIGNGTWEDNEERQDALNECDSLYFERPENIEESLFAFIKANRAKIETLGLTMNDECQLSDGAAKSIRQAYNLVTDTVIGPNLRRRDNLYQGLAILACLVLGAVIGPWTTRDWLFGALVGGFVGGLVGLLGSGSFLMIYRGIHHVLGKHD